MHLRRLYVLILGVAAIAAAPFVLAGSASAATTSLWADWASLAGGSNDYRSTVTVAANPPLIADVTSDSRSGSVGVISGTSTWLSTATPIGSKYGSSRGKPYLNLRPRADNGASPSTTTYTFRTPTPTSGWTFVLGDIDADKVEIRAVGPDGVPLTAAQLGYRSGFNYCVPEVCTPTQAPADVPSWDPVTATLSADRTTNPGSLDTAGAAAWFEPNAPISSLAFVYTRVTGFPVYQTWFASLARDISGTVTDANTGPLDGVPVTLTDSNGTVVGTATTSGGGHYSFPGFLATGGYTVSITPPPEKIAVTESTAPADLTTTDAVVNFTVRDIIPVVVSGTVRDTHGRPIAGANVTVDGVQVITNPDGSYLFDAVPDGTYQAQLVVPDGYSLVSSPPPFTIVAGEKTPIDGQDFIVAANPTISGIVSAFEGGVGGVTVTATGPNRQVSTVTAADGSYRIPRVPNGSYTVTVTPPDDFVVEGPTSDPITIATNDVGGVDFALAKTGSIGGTVTDLDGTGLAGATVTISGPTGSIPVTTDSSGAYGVSGEPPGDYTITLTVPNGYTASGPINRTVTVTPNGDTFAAEDFALEVVAAAPASPSPPGGSASIAGPSGGASTLPDTGSTSNVAQTLELASSLVLGGGLLVGCANLRRRRHPSGLYVSWSEHHRSSSRAPSAEC
ncbi:MSCRAMM family protein [Leifsonia aquatica]|uniref:MSCRAMM family protein n=1 Tax=Leifsonia aquatica TaxID=144185 RepID=UPI0037F4B850